MNEEATQLKVDGESANPIDADKDIIVWRTAMLGATMLCFFLYFVSFCFAWNPKDTDDFYKGWSALGTFIGGVLGPLVAFAAFYWLTESVKIQRVELKKAHEALMESAAAQKEQSEGSKKLVRINALSAIADLADAQLNRINQRILEIDTILEGDSKLGELSNDAYASLKSQRKTLVTQAVNFAGERERYIEEMKSLAH
ncbi:hypothetical protein HS961_09070 [Comamonas piscis]|uniref:Uncharacterized protein n=1 Tax=Comamonas piscis TaxID=1562974 RepID=A0A7G5EG54_9BURK|nr:hypothetical protein [Comamonas piscis]QMV72979.1 hypothetical protein HS961_09070 [Comamonas piscis]WSO35760.1 hypothetical protein VUJ63_09095 [Comamonas piscis]